MRYVSNDTEVKAVQFSTQTQPLALRLIGRANLIGHAQDNCVAFNTPLGPEVARDGDYIIKSSNGALSKCKALVFESLYRPASNAVKGKGKMSELRTLQAR